MMSQNVLRHAQDVQRRVGEVLEPMLTPTHCTTKYLSIQQTDNTLALPQDIQIHSTTVTYDSGHNLEAEHGVVLEELDEREGYQGEVLHLSKDGCPVS